MSVTLSLEQIRLALSSPNITPETIQNCDVSLLQHVHLISDIELGCQLLVGPKCFPMLRAEFCIRGIDVGEPCVDWTNEQFLQLTQKLDATDVGFFDTTNLENEQNDSSLILPNVVVVIRSSLLGSCGDSIRLQPPMNAKPSGVSSVSFLKYVGQLKQVPRTGWVLRGVKSPESVSDHSHRMATCCMLISDPAIDTTRAALMALVHDLAEAITGDIAPGQGVSDAEKEQLEQDAMDKIARQTLGDCKVQGVGVSLYEIWQEYERRETKESMLVKDLDRVEMALQALEYEEQQGILLEEFFQSVRGKIRHPQVLTWFQEIDEAHKSFMLNK